MQVAGEPGALVLDGQLGVLLVRPHQVEVARHHLPDAEHRDRGREDREHQADRARPAGARRVRAANTRPDERQHDEQSAPGSGKQHHRRDGACRRARPCRPDRGSTTITSAERERAPRGRPASGRARRAGEAVAVAAQAQPDAACRRRRRRRSRRMPTTPATVSRASPGRPQRVEQEEQPDGGEPRARSAGPTGCPAGIGGSRSWRVTLGRQTRAVSLLIRHAAPSTKIASQATALTTAYQGSSLGQRRAGHLGDAVHRGPVGDVANDRGCTGSSGKNRPPRKASRARPGPSTCMTFSPGTR